MGDRAYITMLDRHYIAPDDILLGASLPEKNVCSEDFSPQIYED